MKHKLLAMSTETHVNIGDYIQALASSQFLPKIDGFIERERLNEYDGDKTKVIMNGWYMHHPNNWPPAPNIEPLFVAFHINTMAKEALLSNKSIAYLKKHQPIGCRDTNTYNMLASKGVESYFSACMTLTLGYKYRSEERDNKCYFVDPSIDVSLRNNIKLCFSSLYYLLLHLSQVYKVYIKYPFYGNKIKKMILISNYLKQYSKFFTLDTLLNAEYICHQSHYYKDHFRLNEDKLKEAERLVNKYAKAKLVVTSRIHCALPCLGLETPVIFTENISDNEVSSCRFGGLSELFNIMNWSQGKLTPTFDTTGLLSKDNTIRNKPHWIKYKNDLLKRCISFVKE